MDLLTSVMHYSRGVHRACVSLGLVAALTGLAAADGIAIVGGSPRSIGRAGTNTVGDDGGGALLVNPAAIARREGTRIQLGLAIEDDSIVWDPVDPAGPIARDQSGPSLLPLVAVVGSIGSWVIGAGVMTSGVTDRALRDPRDVPRAEDLNAAFEYRYSGIAAAIRRDTLTLGVARRLGDAIAVGVSGGGSRVRVSETRRLWAGFAGISDVGDPKRDVELAMAGEDAFVPSLTAGLLIAPIESPMELAVSVAWTARTEIEGDVGATGTSGGPIVRLTAPHASLAFKQPVSVRAGARYLGDRFVLELGGDLWLASHSARRASWTLDGVRVVDPSTVGVDLVGMPSRLSLRTHGAIRGALDVELIPGFLWATGGYAYTIGSTTQRRLSPTFGDLGGHTVALGVEGTAGGVTFTIGWSRTLATRRSGGDELSLDNPFGAGDAAVASGTFDATFDQLGVLLDLQLDAPD
ncbi:MAG: hypothetical protein JWP01_1716 [Myxococcales bacterium]|nr:hypothetical protein [Myxococcales bacterium]